MPEDEALKVANAVKNDLYPPINPAVLLNAAHTLYLNGGDHADIRRILIWCLYVMTDKDQNVPDAEREAAVGLYFAVGQ